MPEKTETLELNFQTQCEFGEWMFQDLVGLLQKEKTADKLITVRTFLRLETEVGFFEVFFPNPQNPGQGYKITEKKKAPSASLENVSPPPQHEYQAISTTANVSNFRFHALDKTLGSKEILHIGPLTKPAQIIVQIQIKPREEKKETTISPQKP